MKVHERLKQARMAQGLSQYELADKVKNLNQSQISKIENGERRITISDIVALSKALEIPIELLVKNSAENVKG